MTCRVIRRLHGFARLCFFFVVSHLRIEFVLVLKAVFCTNGCACVFVFAAVFAAVVCVVVCLCVGLCECLYTTQP